MQLYNLPVRIKTPCANLSDVRAIKPLHDKLAQAGYECSINLGCYIDTNRNKGVSGTNQNIHQKHEDGFTIFIDSDISCTVEDVGTLVDLAYTHDIIGVPYRTQEDGNLDCCRNKIGSKTGIVEVTEIGFGLIAIRNKVFNKMRFPYFRRPIVKIEDCADMMGEDIYFCKMAHKAGFKIYANYDIKITHNIRKEQMKNPTQENAEKGQGIPMSIASHCLQLSGWYDTIIQSVTSEKARAKQTVAIIQQYKNTLTSIFRQLNEIESKSGIVENVLKQLNEQISKF